MKNNQLLLNSTMEEFVEALRQGLGLALNGEGEGSGKSYPQKHYVYGLHGLANLLGCSHSTAARIHQSGAVAAATCRSGRILVFDSDLAMDLLKVGQRRSRRADLSINNPTKANHGTNENRD